MNLAIQSHRTGNARYWSFSFKEFSGWATFTINDDTKEFIIQSDWGEWSHRWSAAGVREPMIHFLVDCDPEYVVRKFAQGGKSGFKELDIETTFKGLHRHVCELRREECITKEEAREVWRDLKQWRHTYWETFGAGAGSDQATIAAAYLNTPETVALHDLLQYEWVCWKQTTHTALLQNELLPFFFKYLEENEL